MRAQKRRRMGTLALIVLSAFWAGSSLADGKRLEVISAKAVVHLDPDERSTVVETLARGSLVTLASACKLRTNWFYVYFVSMDSGKTLSGYILEADVRKLYPVLQSVHIGSEDEILNPKPVNLSAPLQTTLEWGNSKASILLTEGRPVNETSSQGLEVLQYRREIMDKKCLVEYFLSQNKLITARVHLLENYADKTRYIDDYNQIRGFLTAKVGEPRSDKIVWQSSSAANNRQPLGDALSIGEVEFSSEWVFRDTAVHIVLAGADHKISFGAEIVDVKSKTPASF